MKAKKWNPFNGRDFLFELPKGTRVDANLGEIVPCANCGKLVDFGDCYDSLFIRSYGDMPYPVCPSCFYDETCDYNDSKRTGTVI